MNVVFLKDWFNPDTGKTIKKGQMCDLIDWKIKELESDGIIQVPEKFDIVQPKKEVKEKEFEFEEITEPKKKKTYF